MPREVFHKVDVDNLSLLIRRIEKLLTGEDSLALIQLNNSLPDLSRGQILCALDAMERQEIIVTKKIGSQIFVELI